MLHNPPLPRKRSLRCIVLAMLSGGLLPVLDAQTFGFISQGPGLQLDSVSVNASYSLLPTSGTGQVFTTGTQPMKWDVHTGVNASVSWAKMFAHGDASFSYRGGYGRRVQTPEFWDMYHSGHFNYSYYKAIKPRLTYTIGLNAQVIDFESYFLAPAGTSPATPTTVTPPGVPSLGNGLFQASPAQSALYGDRVLTAQVSNNFNFAKSARLSYDFGLSVIRSQYLGGGGGGGSNATTTTTTPTTNQNTNSSRGLLGRGSYGNAFASANFLLTERTTIGASASVSRGFSRLGNYYYTNAQFNVGRTMTPWWNLAGFAGAGFSGSLANPKPTGGINTRFFGYSQSVVLSASATIDDIYAIGASRTLAATLGWNLHSPGSHWSFHASGSDYWLGDSGGNGSLSTWRATAGVNRVLTDHLFWGFSANYANFQGLLLNNLAGASGSSYASAFNNQSYRGVQMSLSWTPAGLKW